MLNVSLFERILGIDSWAKKIKKTDAHIFLSVKNIIFFNGNDIEQRWTWIAWTKKKRNETKWNEMKQTKTRIN